MIDETGNTPWTQGPSPASESAAEQQQAAAAEPAGFCQDCGRPLTRATARVVGTGIFCEPCLQVRLAGGGPGRPRYTAPGTMPPAPGQPSPALAGVLGMIPGVGAMYNGQFAKGIAHIAIFAVLTFLSDHVNGIFGVMVAGWIVYQIFDAIHTARARRDGLPLPDTFGLNDIGERFAYGRNWTGYTAPPRPAGTNGPVPPAPAASAAPEAPAPGWNHVPPAPSASVPPVNPSAPYRANWAGYVPPTTFGHAYAAPPTQPPSGTPFAPVNGSAVPPAAVGRVGRFPVGALWLIALGFLFLLANVVPSWHFGERWAAPVALLVFAGWWLYRRLAQIDQIRAASAVTGRPYLVSVLRVPLILAVLALEFILQNLNIATVGQTWPLILIVVGGAALIDRAGTVPPLPVEPGRFGGPIPPAPGPSAEPPAHNEVQP